MYKRQTVLLSPGVPIETVSRLLGHTNIKTTQIYAKITAQKISQDMEDSVSYTHLDVYKRQGIYVDFREWLHNPARQPQSENIQGRFRMGTAAATRIAKFFGR